MSTLTAYDAGKMSKAEILSAWRSWQIRTFVTIWITYGTFYLCRANMSFALPVRPAWRPRVPAVVHRDGSARVQTVHADLYPMFYSLLDAFRDLTGVPMVLNTSFNRRGEPIVCSPADAVGAFCRTGLDLLGSV